MRWLSLVDESNVEPIEVAEAKRHLRIEATDTYYDALIDGLIQAARERAELETGRQLITAGYELALSAFPCDGAPIELPRPPLAAVSSITYVDSNGTTQTWSASDYQVLAPSGPYAARGLVLPVYGETYPDTRPETLEAVTVAYTAGYGAGPANVPRAIRQAMLLLIGDWFRFPEQVVAGGAAQLPLPVGAAALLRPYRNEPTQW
jgi:uncharacterized phiE125 gp8 family phage protein